MATSIIDELVKAINIQANKNLAKVFNNKEEIDDFELSSEFKIIGFDGGTSDWFANRTDQFYKLFADQIIDYAAINNYTNIYLYNLDLVKYEKIVTKELDTTRTYVLVTVWIKGEYKPTTIVIGKRLGDIKSTTSKSALGMKREAIEKMIANGVIKPAKKPLE